MKYWLQSRTEIWFTFHPEEKYCVWDQVDLDLWKEMA